MNRMILKQPRVKYLAIVAVLALAVFGFLLTPKVHALSGSDFQAGRIIDDYTFFNSNTMSADDIQRFLNAKVPTCDTNGSQNNTYYYNASTGETHSYSFSGGSQVTTSRAVYGQRADDWRISQGQQSLGSKAPYTCLKDYTVAVPSVSADAYCASIAGGTKSAAMIIKEVSATCSFNPQSMIVLLQKEQGLVTDDWPWGNEYKFATGYCVYDSTPPSICAGTDGFFNQVYYAARQFRYYLAHNGVPGNYWVGNYNIPYSTDGSCGGSIVNIRTQATAALYDYTPYQPNAGALAVVSDSSPGGTAPCGAYGNRNFWWYFNTWFGSVYSNDTFTPHPNGTLISLGSQVHLIENGAKRWITNGDVFNSYGYAWFQVKVGSTGDANLAHGPDINALAPGTIFTTDNSPVYVMTYESGNLVEQQISAAAFNSLGYNWNEVVYVPPGNVPAATASSILFANQHPAGTLVAGSGKAYLLDQTSKRWILNPDAFNTNNFDWNKVKTATDLDLNTSNIPDGTPVDLRQGNMLISGGNIYLVDYDTDGILKRPVGPWECFADRWHYAYRDLYQTVALPDRTGSLATC